MSCCMNDESTFENYFLWKDLVVSSCSKNESCQKSHQRVHWDNSDFCFQKYVENVKQDTNIGSNILRVSASDEDADNNGAIRYSLTAPNDPADLDYFDIQPESGWIFLQKPLDVSWNRFRSALLLTSDFNDVWRPDNSPNEKSTNGRSSN